jgi:hypothetical protein
MFDREFFPLYCQDNGVPSKHEFGTKVSILYTQNTGVDDVRFTGCKS